MNAPWVDTSPSVAAFDRETTMRTTAWSPFPFADHRTVAEVMRDEQASRFIPVHHTAPQGRTGAPVTTIKPPVAGNLSECQS